MREPQHATKRSERCICDGRDVLKCVAAGRNCANEHATAATTTERFSVAIRKATAEERRDKFSPIVANGPRIRAPKYLVVNPATDVAWTVFGIPQGGDTRAEAVFWAERLASKNDLRFQRPAGWEKVEGKLP